MRTLSVPESLFTNGRMPFIFNDLVSDLLPRAAQPTGSQKQRAFPIDVEERDGGYAVIANLPGVAKDAIEITVEDERLTIAVTAPKEEDEAAKRYLHRERRPGAMSRTVVLQDASAENVEAVLQDGVLTVTVKKDEKHQPRRIQIR